jgi:hypothetical protein
LLSNKVFNEVHFEHLLSQCLSCLLGTERVRTQYPVSSNRDEGKVFGIPDLAVLPTKLLKPYNQGFLVELKRKYDYRCSRSERKKYEQQRSRYEQISGMMCLLVYKNDIPKLIMHIEQNTELVRLRGMF